MEKERLIWKDEFGATHSTDEKINGKYVGNKAIQDKLYEYEQEESEGRLIHLPCKVGDTVYVIENNEIIEDFVDQIGIGYYCDGENIYQMDGIKTDWYFSDIGKTVFLTKSEAEQALKERENNG